MVEYLKEEYIESYIKFIKSVFDYECKYDLIKKMMNEYKVLIILDKEKVIASAFLIEGIDYIKNEKFYSLEYFGVLEEYRKMGYAKLLFNRIEEIIKENNIKKLKLTSGNQRKAAHVFYHNNGFKIKDTTVFIKTY